MLPPPVMDDLGLFRRLRGDDLGDAASLAQGLDELARQPLAARWPFFGLLPPCFAHADARVRAAAVRVLRQADGLPALHAIVGALDDDDASVRAAAVSSLAASTQAHPWRFAHAVFHGRPDVRRAALAADVPAESRGMLFYLVADPELGDSVRQLVRRKHEPLDPPETATSVVIELGRSGLLSPDDVRATLTRQAAWVAWWARSAPPREPARINAVFHESALKSVPPSLDRELGHDAVDDLVEIFHGLPDADAYPFWRALSGTMHVADALLARRLFVSLLRAAHRRGDASLGVPLSALTLVALHQPFVLGFRWIPLELRRAAAYALPSVAGRYGKRDAAIALPTLYAEPFRDGEGNPDLRAIVALLETTKQPWKALVGALSPAVVLAALERSPEDAAWLLALPDDGTSTRAPLLAQAGVRNAAALTRGLAHAALRAANLVALVDGTSEDQRTRMLSALLSIAGQPAHAVDGKRAASIVAATVGSLSEANASTLLRAWLVGAAPATHTLGLALVAALGQRLDTDAFVRLVRALPAPLIAKLTEALPYANSFPWGKQLALASALRDDADTTLATWATELLAPPGESRHTPRTPLTIDATAAIEITTAAHAHLARVLAACATTPHLGVAALLARRREPAPSVAACTALLLAHDPLADVVRELGRYSSADGNEIEEAARAMCAHAMEPLAPGLAGRATLWRWESHARAVLDTLESESDQFPGGLPDVLRAVAGWRTPRVGGYVLSCLAAWCRDARYRDRDALARRATPELVAALVHVLALGQTDASPEAGRVLAALHESGAAASVLAQARDTVSALLPELDAATRDALAPWIDAEGLPPRPARAPTPILSDGALLAAIRSSRDLPWLASLARATERRVTDEAVVRLVELDGGPDALAALLAGTPLPHHAEAIAESVALWPPATSLVSLVPLLAREDVPVAVRFRIAMSLLERGAHEHRDAAVALAARPCDPRAPFIRARDFGEMVKAGIGREQLSITLAGSAQPHAYRPAIETLLRLMKSDEGVSSASSLFPPPPRADLISGLRVFVEAGTTRIGELRRRAVRVLDAEGDESVLPLVLSDAVRAKTPPVAILAGRPAGMAAAAARALLVAGPRVASEKLIDRWLTAPGVAPEAQLDVFADVLVMGRDDQVRALAAKRLARPDRRARKLRDIAETFAWGIARGRELTGRLFDVRMIGGRAWGYTRFDSSAVHVTTLPILQRARWGRQIVEGLILHEIGHHMYHRGPRAKEVWAESTRAGMHGVLNLVADEHLERNLRALDPEYGDRLKRLAAHAFQHADKEVAVLTLLVDLGARAFSVLTASPLRVARDDESVSLRNGELLLAMEAAGLSFPRFVRALRMGLGDRHDDPKVREALELFGTKTFRESSMDELWKIAQRMKDIFGWEVKLIERLGCPESLEPGDAEETVHGEGISDADVTGEVERVLDPRGQKGASGSPGGKRWVNVNPEESFDPIDKVVAVKHDPAAHGELAKHVARPARTMRSLLEHLGLAAVPQRRRLSGHSFDRGSARALVLLGDPHVLIARPVRSFDDLFLGLVIDCSGSMASRGNMDRAKRFATLLAEAARGLPGVSLRVYGFTDKVIYEAGTADRCAAHALVAQGGNNDAAALWYAMGVARASKRKAKVLVMISDGLPTECSVAALRAVVRRGKREGVLCAQIAVQPLAEVCFPHYVVVDDEDLDAAARKFGGIVSKLVRTALSTA